MTARLSKHLSNRYPATRPAHCRQERPCSASTHEAQAPGLCMVGCYLLYSKNQRELPMGLMRHDHVKRRRVCKTARLLNNRGAIAARCRLRRLNGVRFSQPVASNIDPNVQQTIVPLLRFE